MLVATPSRRVSPIGCIPAVNDDRDAEHGSAEQASGSAETPPAKRTVGGGATVATGASFATAVVGGLLTVLVARLLGPDDTGLYNVVATTLLVGFTLGTLGINVGASYFVGAGRWHAGDAFRQLQLAAIVAGLGTTAAGLLVALAGRDSLFEGVPARDLVIALGVLPFMLSWTFTSAVALALGRYETYALAPLATNAVALALSCVLSPLVGLTGAVVALATAQVVGAAALLVWGRRTLPQARPGWLRRTRQELGGVVRFGLQSYAPQALQLLSYRADLFILNAVAASAVVGRYAVALAVTELGVLLPRALSAIVMPRVSALDAPAGKDEQRMVIEKSVRHAIVLSPGIALVLLIGVAAIPLVFGSGFAGAIGPGLILIPGVLCLGVANVMAASVVGMGFPRYALVVAAVVTPPTLALYAVLVPALEAYGAAIASTASYAAVAAATAIAFARATGIRQARVVLPTRADLRDYPELFNRGRDYLRERLPGR